MTSPVPMSQPQAAFLPGGWNLGALMHRMLDAWLAHHQRLAECRIGGL